MIVRDCICSIVYPQNPILIIIDPFVSDLWSLSLSLSRSRSLCCVFCRLCVCPLSVSTASVLLLSSLTWLLLDSRLWVLGGLEKQDPVIWCNSVYVGPLTWSPLPYHDLLLCMISPSTLISKFEEPLQKSIPNGPGYRPKSLN